MAAVTAGSRPPDPRTALYLVRHGEADSNRDLRFGGWSAAALTELGVRQARAVGHALAAHRPTAIVSSDLVRARQTADAVAEATGLPLELDADLRERSVGVFDGMSFADAEARYPDAWKRLLARDPDVVPEGAETADQVFERVSRALDRIVVRHAGGRVVVVSHGIALYHAFSHVCGLGSPRGRHRVFVLTDNASVTHLEHHAGDARATWRIHTLNDTAHLADL
jgi:broad specificity phosphatase PhoE